MKTMESKAFAPIAMAEEYWANSQLSIARYYGGLKYNGHDYQIVNKQGITLMELSDPDSKHYVAGDRKAIEPGEPADLVRKGFIPFYKKLGRDLFIDILKEHQQASDVELKKIYKELTKRKR